MWPRELSEGVAAFGKIDAATWLILILCVLVAVAACPAGDVGEPSRVKITNR